MSGIQLPRGVSQIRAICYKINLCSIEVRPDNYRGEFTKAVKK
jgi:hypothetical protein